MSNFNERSYQILFTITILILGACGPVEYQVPDPTDEASTASQELNQTAHIKATAFTPKLTDLMGGNGKPGNATVLAKWKAMGLRFSRVNMYPADSTSKVDLKNKGYMKTDNDADIKFNAANGIETVLLLAYTPTWNGAVMGDSKSKPLDPSVWTEYVQAVVNKYKAAPYNVKYFQIWNEAAGQFVVKGKKQSDFWHGTGFRRTLVSSKSSLCLDMSGGKSTDNNWGIVQNSCGGQVNQDFSIYAVGGEKYQLKVTYTNKCVVVPAESVGANNVQVKQYDCKIADNQLYTINENLDTGEKQFVNVASGKCLGIRGNSGSAGAALETQVCTTGASQKFKQANSSAMTPYADAIKDYVETIHIPAAKIIRAAGKNIVYGGWPDQGGFDTFYKWLEYKSAKFNNQRILDWVDYIDTHYLGENDMQTFYRRYASSGKIKGVWQTEVGFDYMSNHNYIAKFYFKMAIMALNNSWNDVNKFVSMVYHSAGGEGFMLLDQDGNYHDTGRTLVTLKNMMGGALSLYSHPITWPQNSEGRAIWSDSNLVIQVEAPQGSQQIVLNGSPSRSFKIAYYDAINGKDLTASSGIKATWVGTILTVKLTVPAGHNDLKKTYRNHMGYIVVTPTSTATAKVVAAPSRTNTTSTSDATYVNPLAEDLGNLQESVPPAPGSVGPFIYAGNELYNISSGKGNLCLEIPDSIASEAKSVLLSRRECDDGANQRYSYTVRDNGVVELISARDGFCLEVSEKELKSAQDVVSTVCDK